MSLDGAMERLMGSMKHGKTLTITEEALKSILGIPEEVETVFYFEQDRDTLFIKCRSSNPLKFTAIFGTDVSLVPLYESQHYPRQEIKYYQ